MAGPKDQKPEDRGDAPKKDDPWLHWKGIDFGKDGEDDDTFVEVGELEVDGKGRPLQFPDDDWRVEVGGQIDVKGKVGRGRFAWSTEDADDAPDQRWELMDAGSFAPMVATVGSFTAHGSPLGPGIGSANVHAGGLPVWRMLLDTHACPLATPQPHGAGVVAPLGPPSRVFVNGVPIARAGDAVVEAGGGPNPIVSGVVTVHAGPPMPPMKTVNPEPIEVPHPDPMWERALDWIVDVDAGIETEIVVAPTTTTVGGGPVLDLDDAAAGGSLDFRTEGELAHSTGSAHIRFRFFGDRLSFGHEEEWDRGVGKFEVEGGVVVDPFTKRVVPDGDASFELFPEPEAPDEEP